MCFQQGDSGGPIVCFTGGQYHIAGVVSFGDYCSSQKPTPGVYARLSYVLPWIKATI